MASLGSLSSHCYDRCRTVHNHNMGDAVSALQKDLQRKHPRAWYWAACLVTMQRHEHLFKRLYSIVVSDFCLNVGLLKQVAALARDARRQQCSWMFAAQQAIGLLLHAPISFLVYDTAVYVRYQQFEARPVQTKIDSWDSQMLQIMQVHLCRDHVPAWWDGLQAEARGVHREDHVALCRQLYFEGGRWPNVLFMMYAFVGTYPRPPFVQTKLVPRVPTDDEKLAWLSMQMSHRVPDYALDMHTKFGLEQKRGFEHYFQALDQDVVEDAPNA